MKTGQKNFQSHDPASGKVLWEGLEAAEHEVNSAIVNARLAFEGWSALSLNKRIDYLYAFRDLLQTSKDILVETISQETGKPLWDSRGEFAAMVNKIDISIDAYADRCGEKVKHHPLGLSLTRHKPHGVVAVLGPYNFPGHLPNGHIIPALLAGNTVIFKPSELTPLTGEVIFQCWKKTGIPAGVINLVQGGKETGRMISVHPDLDGLFFTGSWETGKLLIEHFASHPEKILALEMGGNNPLVAFDISDTKAAAYFIIQSAFISSGQRCTCARRLIIPKGEKGDQLLNDLIEMMKGIIIGPYYEVPEPFMGPVISEESARRLLETQSLLQAKNGKILVEMMHTKPKTGFITPGLIDATLIKDRADQEVFGPLLQVIRVLDFEEAIKEANQTSYGLVAGLLSDREDLYREFYQKVRAGVINWNTPTTGASSNAPFGGIGRSGNFRPSAYYAADYCSYPVASIESPQLKMPDSKTAGIL